jgi:porphobilinogen deaminase
VPIGVHCTSQAMTGVVAAPDGQGVVRVEMECPKDGDPARLGEAMAERLLHEGAGALLAAAGP